MYRVFIYRGTGNLGDAVQTVALARLLGNRCRGIYRDEPAPTSSRGVLVANGWLGYRVPEPENDFVCAGIHLARHERQFAAWLSGARGPVGSRDSYTSALLRGFRVETEMIGCATLTFERYRGHRRGRYSVDAGSCPGSEPLSNSIGDLSWPEQWERAIAMLDLLRRAELVWTTRLHVVLPCLAFGTPVIFPSAGLDGILEKQRLTLLGDVPFVFDEPITADVSAMSHRYWTFLERALGRLRPARRASLPQPLV